MKNTVIHSDFVPLKVENLTEEQKNGEETTATVYWDYSQYVSIQLQEQHAAPGKKHVI